MTITRVQERLVSSASGATRSITYSPQPSAGNLLVATIQHAGTKANAALTTAGWTLIVSAETSAAVDGCSIYARICDGTEGTTVATTATLTSPSMLIVNEYHSTVGFSSDVTKAVDQTATAGTTAGTNVTSLSATLGALTTLTSHTAVTVFSTSTSSTAASVTFDGGAVSNPDLTPSNGGQASKNTGVNSVPGSPSVAWASWASGQAAMCAAYFQEQKVWTVTATGAARSTAGRVTQLKTAQASALARGVSPSSVAASMLAPKVATAAGRVTPRGLVTLGAGSNTITKVQQRTTNGASGTNVARTITWSSAPVVGNLLLAALGHQGAANVLGIADAGWTLLGSSDNGSGACGVAIFGRFADGTEAATLVTLATMSGANHFLAAYEYHSSIGFGPLEQCIEQIATAASTPAASVTELIAAPSLGVTSHLSITAFSTSGAATSASVYWGGGAASIPDYGPGHGGVATRTPSVAPPLPSARWATFGAGQAAEVAIWIREQVVVPVAAAGGRTLNRGGVMSQRIRTGSLAALGLSSSRATVAAVTPVVSITAFGEWLAQGGASAGHYIPGSAYWPYTLADDLIDIIDSSNFIGGGTLPIAYYSQVEIWLRRALTVIGTIGNARTVAARLGDYLPKSGGIVTGPVIVQGTVQLGADPSLPLGAGTKQYADRVFSTAPAAPGLMALNPSTIVDGHVPVYDAASTSWKNVMSYPRVRSTSLPVLTIGVAYNSGPLVGTLGRRPYVWTATGLPAGLSMASGTGAITGTYSGAATTAAVVVTITDALGHAKTKTLSLSCIATSSAPNITTTTIPQAFAGVAYNSGATVVAGGTAPFVFTASGLPPYLTVNSATGAVTGTPPSGYLTTFGITVTDAALATDTQSFQFFVDANKVLPPTPIINDFRNLSPNNSRGIEQPGLYDSTGETVPAGAVAYVDPTNGVDSPGRGGGDTLAYRTITYAKAQIEASAVNTTILLHQAAGSPESQFRESFPSPTASSKVVGMRPSPGSKCWVKGSDVFTTPQWTYDATFKGWWAANTSTLITSRYAIVGGALSAAIDATQTSIPIANRSLYPQPGLEFPFCIQIGAEKMLVIATGAGAGNFTVTRHIRGTAAASAASGAAVDRCVAEGDQLFVDSTPYVQDNVPFTAASTPGHFYVDHQTNRIWIGEDSTWPIATHTIEVTTRGYLNGSGVGISKPGFIMRGFGIGHFGSDWNNDINGAVRMSGTVATSPQQFKRMTVAYASCLGLDTSGAKGLVMDQFVIYNCAGLCWHDFASAGNRYTNYRLERANWEFGYDITPGAAARIAGLKAASTSGNYHDWFAVRNCHSVGWWADVQCQNTTATHWLVADNFGYGVDIENSDGFLVVDGLAVRNGNTQVFSKDGIRLSGSFNTEVAHVTSVDNVGSAFGIYEDARTQAIPDLHWDGALWTALSGTPTLPALPGWNGVDDYVSGAKFGKADTCGGKFYNNVLAGTSRAISQLLYSLNARTQPNTGNPQIMAYSTEQMWSLDPTVPLASMVAVDHHNVWMRLASNTQGQFKFSSPTTDFTGSGYQASTNLTFAQVQARGGTASKLEQNSLAIDDLAAALTKYFPNQAAGNYSWKGLLLIPGTATSAVGAVPSAAAQAVLAAGGGYTLGQPAVFGCHDVPICA